jgi:hypothetical protein
MELFSSIQFFSPFKNWQCDRIFTTINCLYFSQNYLSSPFYLLFCYHVLIVVIKKVYMAHKIHKI